MACLFAFIGGGPFFSRSWRSSRVFVVAGRRRYADLVTWCVGIDWPACFLPPINVNRSYNDQRERNNRNKSHQPLACTGFGAANGGSASLAPFLLPRDSTLCGTQLRLVVAALLLLLLAPCGEGGILDAGCDSESPPPPPPARLAPWSVRNRNAKGKERLRANQGNTPI